MPEGNSNSLIKMTENAQIQTYNWATGTSTDVVWLQMIKRR